MSSEGKADRSGAAGERAESQRQRDAEWWLGPDDEVSSERPGTAADADTPTPAGSGAAAETRSADAIPGAEEQWDGERNDPGDSADGASSAWTGGPDALERPGRPTPLGERKRKPRGRRLAKPDETAPGFSAQERLLILDAWQRSGLPAGDFAPLVGISKHTLYLWKKLFTQLGPAGLMEQPRGARPGSKLSEVTKRTILMLKTAHPDWGVERISDELRRGPALAASPPAVARFLRESGYERTEEPTQPHPDRVRRFERARPNQLWQTDLFTFVLKRQNRRLFLVAFMDDHSRFLVGYGLHASASTALVLEVVRAAIGNYGPPAEILTDNGPQYVTWRGTSQFSRELQQQGIRQIVARPRHPQTLGKIERFWGTLWRECLERAVFLDLEDARRRVGLFIDHYNFARPHQGLDGLPPADRFFQAAPTVLQMLKQRVAANALELARHGTPRPPFYVTGQVAGQPFSVHAEGERVILTRPGQPRQEVELVGPPAPADAPAATSVTSGPATNPASPAETSPSTLPVPVCPHAAPASGDEVPDVPAPGVSWYEQFPLAPELAPEDIDFAELVEPSSESSAPADDDEPSPPATNATGGES